MNTFDQLIRGLEDGMYVDFYQTQYGGRSSTRDISVDDETKFTLIKMENVRFGIVDSDKCIPFIKISETHISEGSKIIFKTLSKDDINLLDNLSDVQFQSRYSDIRKHLMKMLDIPNKIIIMKVNDFLEGYLEYDILDDDILIIDLVANKSCNTPLFTFAKNVFEQCGFRKIYRNEILNQKDSVQRLRFWQKSGFLIENIHADKNEVRLIFDFN